MKRFRWSTGAVTALLAAMAFAPLPAAAADSPRCANPSGSVDQRACAMAAAGPEALRRFIERTRGFYMLYYPDYAPSAR